MTYRIGIDQGQGPLGVDTQPWSDDDIRNTCVQIACACIGLHALDPRYADLVGPGESKQMRRDMLKMSGCGLVVRGVWRLLGVDHHRLVAPYRIGAAFRDLHEVGDGAWVPADGSSTPPDGAAVMIGDGVMTHVATVVGVESTSLLTVDGGQVGRYGQEVRLRTRPYNGRLLGDRRVHGWWDVARMRERLKLDWWLPA